MRGSLHPQAAGLMLSVMRSFLTCTALLFLCGCYPRCPGSEDVSIEFGLSPSLVDIYGTAFFDGDVTVTDVTQRGEQWDVDLTGTGADGVERDLRLTMTTTPVVELPLEEGDELHFQWLQDEPIRDWVNTFAGLWRGRELVLGLLDQGIEIKGNTRVDPLELDVRHGFCRRNTDNCGAHERVGIRFTHPDGQSELVFDHQSSILLGDPSYAIHVQQATVNYDSLFVPCPARPRGWLRAVIANISG